MAESTEIFVFRGPSFPLPRATYTVFVLGGKGWGQLPSAELDPSPSLFMLVQDPAGIWAP